MENTKNKLKVGVSSMPPFVTVLNEKYSGFEVDLWGMVAKEMSVEFEYEKHNFQDLIPLIKDKKADVAFASITINEKREEVVDFSHATFNSGLHILLSKNRKNIDFGATAKSFFSEGYKQLVKPMIFLLVLLFVLGTILFLSEKNSESISPYYFPGIFQAAWISVSSMLGLDGGFFVYTVGSWTGRLIVALGQIMSLAVFGLFIGEISAFITTKKIRLTIEGPKDLSGKTVATVQGTTSEAVLRHLGSVVVPVVTIDEAYEKLKNNKVDAVVFDAPILVYYTLNDGSDWAEITGEVFDKQDYGFVVQEGGALRKDINLAILTLKENGSYDELYKKWFGDSE